MTRFPIIFDHSFGVRADDAGFVASVDINGGRILAQLEDDGSWAFYGVQPGGVVGTGATPVEASQDFNKNLADFVSSLADEAADFGSFEDMACDVLEQVNDDAFYDWNAAVAEVKAGTLDIPGSPRRNSSVPPTCSISCVGANNPQTLNQLPSLAQLLAA